MSFVIQVLRAPIKFVELISALYNRYPIKKFNNEVFYGMKIIHWVAISYFERMFVGPWMGSFQTYCFSWFKEVTICLCFGRIVWRWHLLQEVATCDYQALYPSLIIYYTFLAVSFEWYFVCINTYIILYMMTRQVPTLYFAEMKIALKLKGFKYS